MEQKNDNNDFTFKSCLTIIGVLLLIGIGLTLVNGVLDGIGYVLSQIPWYVWTIIVIIILILIQRK